MVIVDTSVWIEFLRGHQPYFDELSVLIADDQVLASATVFGELLQGIKNKREEKIILQFWSDLPKVPADVFEKSWIEAGLLSSKNKFYSKGIGLIDASLISLAQITRAKLWTLDAAVMNAAGQLAVRI